jgi:hypothetical protein
MAWKSQLNPASPVARPSGRSALTSQVSSARLESRRMRQEIGAQVGRLGQRGQAERERQPFVVGQRPGVGDAGLAGALGQQQRPDRLPG